MKIKSIFVAVVVLMAAAFTFQAFFGAMAQAQDTSAILDKLTKIMKSQDAMAQDLAIIKSELNIIKIRVTQIQ